MLELLFFPRQNFGISFVFVFLSSFQTQPNPANLTRSHYVTWFYPIYPPISTKYPFCTPYQHRFSKSDQIKFFRFLLPKKTKPNQFVLVGENVRLTTHTLYQSHSSLVELFPSRLLHTVYFYFYS